MKKCSICKKEVKFDGFQPYFNKDGKLIEDICFKCFSIRHKVFLNEGIKFFVTEGGT